MGLMKKLSFFYLETFTESKNAFTKFLQNPDGSKYLLQRLVILISMVFQKQSIVPIFSRFKLFLTKSNTLKSVCDLGECSGAQNSVLRIACICSQTFVLASGM